MARQKLSDRPTIIIHAKKLKEIAKDEGITYRTAQRRKDLFAQVIVHFGENKLRKDEKKGELKTQIRYLDSKTTELLRASWLTFEHSIEEYKKNPVIIERHDPSKAIKTKKEKYCTCKGKPGVVCQFCCERPSGRHY